MSTPKIVYLSGTISDSNKTELWRVLAGALLEQEGIFVLNPLRGRPGEVDDAMYVERDIVDVRGSDLVLLYFPKEICPSRQSIGTWAEFGIAVANKIPVVVVTDDVEIACHPFIRRFSMKVTPSMAEGLKAVKWFLT